MPFCNFYQYTYYYFTSCTTNAFHLYLKKWRWPSNNGACLGCLWLIILTRKSRCSMIAKLSYGMWAVLNSGTKYKQSLYSTVIWCHVPTISCVLPCFRFFNAIWSTYQLYSQIARQTHFDASGIIQISVLLFHRFLL